MNGIFSINKPAGVTSREVVDEVSRFIRATRRKKQRRRKVGHAGTLDPLATGVLLVCVGSATRLVPLLHEHAKTYRAEFRLGETSDTDDGDGVIVRHETVLPTANRIAAVLTDFVGRIAQRPPSYSALRISGRRAYELARAQQAVELPPREVTVSRIQLIDYSPPLMTVDVECSSGTYIRSLARDFGERIGTGALMSALTRVSIGPFHIAGSLSSSGDGHFCREQLLDCMLPMQSAVSHLPQLVLTHSEAEMVRSGCRLSWPGMLRSDRVPTTIDVSALDRIALIEDQGDLAAIAEVQARRLQPRIVFPV